MKCAQRALQAAFAGFLRLRTRHVFLGVFLLSLAGGLFLLGFLFLRLGMGDLALGRGPTTAEKEQAVRFLSGEEKSMANLCLVLLNMNEFLYVD